MISAILRQLPSFKGKQRLAKLLLSKEALNAQDVIIHGKDNCIFKTPNVKENIGFEILINGSYEPDTVNFIASRIKPGSTLLDVGANIGAISIPVTKKRPDLNVICIEAAPWIVKYLQENIFANGISVMTVLNRAISDLTGEEVLFYSPQEKFGKGSLSPVFTQEGIKVSTVTLDELAMGREVGFIKIDVEGFELQAFRGGVKLLKGDDAPDILFEFVDWAEARANFGPGDAQALLMSYGYQIHIFENDMLSKALAKPLTEGSYLLYATKKPNLSGQ
jgi:FkbM family methyltransferase